MGESLTTRINAWIDRIRAGDDTAFDELVRCFEGRLKGLAGQMLRGFPDLGPREQTDDVLQGALMRLHAALRALVGADKGPAALKTLHAAELSRLAALQIRRELLDLADYHRKRPATELPGSEDLTGPRPRTSNPLDLAIWSEFHQKARSLPEEAREVFALVYYGGLPQADVAELLGVSVRTVRYRWQDARLTLTDALGGRLPGL
jgi:RNA polymerase sigma factor (sigma-70 family)